MERKEIRCAECGGVAAVFSVLRAGAPGGRFLEDRDRLERTGFLGCAVTTPMAHEKAVEFLALLDAPDLRKVDGCDFFCRACARSYCDQCWDVERPEFDGSFYDCTHATCPRGHRQMVDD